ncbi:hypothetical protein BD324DRAFT_648376 [Kockovaella imperatae]|uniref:Uncharacterized protein n=1 Tax=Kockovaella imperatae TaxID=4999 RepID=A0A1Y1UQM8_9TREE|nr:hypothetical protein BD324DRAFT_648376 [Kockovaella imperatae]ORX39746.1 hypothetical protein BD324DRAFT_648376 [Kockovaella imperatae]
MLKLILFALAVAHTATIALAKISGVYVPITAKLGQNITVKLHTIGSPVTYDDFAAIFGLAGSSASVCSTCVGTRIGYVTLLRVYPHHRGTTV